MPCALQKALHRAVFVVDKEPASLLFSFKQANPMDTSAKTGVKPLAPFIRLATASRPANAFIETPAERRQTQVISAIALALSFLYLGWRLTSTFNDESTNLSWFFFLLEFWGAIGFALFVHSSWDLNAAMYPPAVESTDLKLALLIPTYNEPEEILLPTIAAAVALQPAHETWVLDDGRRGWVAEMAESLGARYLVRPDNEHAKAGNLNHALQHTDADLVGVVDADHVPSPDFFTNTVGYFAFHDDLAVVQTPQDFYNADSFEHVGDYAEESLFYRVLQPGKNRWNAAFWCGTSAVLRVDALRSVGGVSTDSVSEDLLTTLRLHAAGWRTIFHNESLAHGLAPGGYQEYKLQRDRWGGGSMEVLRHENPLFKKGLSLNQRIAYTFSLSGWFESWRLLGYLLLPIIVLLSGTFPIDANPLTYAAIFSLMFGSQMLALKRLGRKRSHPLWSMIFDIIRLPVSLVATMRLIVPNTAGFKVTPKGRTGDERQRVDPPALQVAILLMSVVGVLWFVATMAGVTTVEYQSRFAAAIVALVVLVNISLLAIAIHRISDAEFGSERRGGWRVDEQAPVALDGNRCMVESIGLTGGRLRMPAGTALVSATHHQLWLPLDDGVVLNVRPVRAEFKDDENSIAFTILDGQWVAKAALARVLVLRKLQRMGVAVSMRNVDSAQLSEYPSAATVERSKYWIPPTSSYKPMVTQLIEKRFSRSTEQDGPTESLDEAS